MMERMRIIIYVIDKEKDNIGGKENFSEPYSWITLMQKKIAVKEIEYECSVKSSLFA